MLVSSSSSSFIFFFFFIFFNLLSSSFNFFFFIDKSQGELLSFYDRMGSADASWKLPDHPKLPKGKTIAVVVLDGWGEASPNDYNCIHGAETPAMDSLKQRAVVKMDDLLKNPVFATHMTAAAGSVALGTALAHPLDAIKTIIQVGSSSSKKVTSSQAIDRVLSSSGYSGLYNGLGWSTFGRIGSLGVRFGIYELLTAFYKDGRADNYVYVSEALLAGIMAGAAESLVTSPFELLKLRAQVTSATRKHPSQIPSTNADLSTLSSRLLRGYSPDKKALEQSVNLLSVFSPKQNNLIDGLRNDPWMMTGSGKPPAVSDVNRPVDIVKLEGWSTLWRGLRSGIARDSIFGGVFFSTWQFLHFVMLDFKALGMNPRPKSDDEIGPLSPLALSSAAGISGSIAAMASHGFDTAKSRSQCVVLPKFISMERRFLRWKRPGNKFERFTGIHPADQSILLRGILWRMARSGIASFATIGSYFFLVDHLMAK